MLLCTSCQSALAISLPSGLSAEAMEKICAAYRQQLSTAHKDYCAFRLEAQQHLRRTEDPLCTIPLAFARVFPPELVRLMDHPSPSTLFREQVQSIEAICTASSCKLSDLEIANEIQTFRLHDHEATNALDVVSAGADLIGTKQKSVLLLALLGWTPMDQRVETDVESQNVTATFGCPLCFSIMEISLLQEQQLLQTTAITDAQDSRRPTKRPKRLARFCNPHDAHRHYCPFRCGFPTTMLGLGTPLWQILLKRLSVEQQKQTSNSHNNEEVAGVHDISTTEKVLDPEAAVARIRGILLAGIAPTKVDLENDDYYDDDEEEEERAIE